MNTLLLIGLLITSITWTAEEGQYFSAEEVNTLKGLCYEHNMLDIVLGMTENDQVITVECQTLDKSND